MNYYGLTFDTDWAPDYAIDYVAGILLENKIKSTWFITHDSPAIEKLKKNPEVFELGLHPNFLPGSSQGIDEDEIIESVLKIVPGSKIVRTHYLVQSTKLLSKMVKEFGIKIDCSMYLPGIPYIVPHKIYFYHDAPSLIRIPFFWEDDFEFYNPENSWDFTDSKYHVPGLKIFNFHPIHIFMNNKDFFGYEKIKLSDTIMNASLEDVIKNKNSCKGTEYFFKNLISFLKSRKEILYSLTEIADMMDKRKH